MSLLERIRKVGAEVESRGDSGSFPAVAREVLERARLHEDLDWDELYRDLATADFPEQFSRASRFGHPPVTLFRNERFFIDIYFWDEPNIAVHSHSFSGAFTVLRGPSLHVEYEFKANSSEDDQVFPGKTIFRNVEILLNGDVREIRSGSSFIHQVWHAGFPSVSLAVRTVKEPDSSKVLTYFPPRLAAGSPQYLSPPAHKRIKLLEFLHRVDPARFLGLLGTLLREGSPLECFWYFVTAYGLSGHDGDVRDLLETSGLDWGDDLLHSLDRSMEGNIRWEMVTGEGERFFLAAALSIYDRPLLLEVLSLYEPGRPVLESAHDHICALLDSEALPWEGDAVAFIVLAGMLNDNSDSVICDAVLQEFETGDRDEVERDVAECRAELASIPFLKTLLTGGGGD